MKVAIISDIHDNPHNLVLALEEIEKKGPEKVLFLGDFVGAAISKILLVFPIPVFAIWGNNDGDRALIMKFSLQEDSNLEMGIDVFDTVELDERKLFLSHYPFIAKSMARSGDFDAVFYGHDHLKNKEMIEGCLLMNPGEIGAYKTGIASYAIYDTEKNDAEIFELDKGHTVTTNTEVSKEKFKSMNFKWSNLKGHKLE